MAAITCEKDNRSK